MKRLALDIHIINPSFHERGFLYPGDFDIGPDGKHPERADYGETLLLERLRTAIHKFNSAIPKEIRDEALRHVQAVAVGGLMTENLALQQARGPRNAGLY